MNKVILIGRVGGDPEVKALPSGTSVANFSVATTEKYTTKAGEKVENTEWHNCTCFDPVASIVSKYVKKGDLLCVEGSIKTDEWVDQSGNARKATKVNVKSVQMLGGNRQHNDSTAQTPVQNTAPAQQEQSFSEEEDDLPF